MKIQDVMTWDVEFCTPEEDLAAAAMIMWRRDCGLVPVVEKGPRRVIGVITDRDICIATATRHRDPAAILVREVMSRPVLTCRPSEDVRIALKTMRESQVRRLPVVDPDGLLKGIVSLNDVVLAIPKGERRTAGSMTEADVIETLKAISSHRLEPSLSTAT